MKQTSLFVQQFFEEELTDIEQMAMDCWIIVHPPPDDFQGTGREWARQKMPARVLRTAKLLDATISDATPTQTRD